MKIVNSICKKGFFLKSCLMVILVSFAISGSFAQPPSHDPTAMIKDENGRYWIYTTGPGIWCMSASNSDFTDWRAEASPFLTWPSWIYSIVPDFNGSFWAPDIIYMNGYYYLYYSVSTFGSSKSAIGVVRTQSLANPNWQDQGMVISSNGGSSEINAIDPAVFVDNDGRAWMAYGSWFGGIGIIEINPSSGKTIGDITHLTGGSHQDIEAPYLFKSGDYYFLFVNRGKCCKGTSSTYYVQVSRSRNITGPYTSWKTFLSSDGRYIGPGHIGYSEGKLTYHYYDGDDHGSPKLMITSLGIEDGWPVAGDYR